MAERRAGTLTGSQGGFATPRAAVVSGYILRSARESADPPMSQERFAEALAVSADTIAGWETGRRPLTAVKTSRILAIRHLLLRAGASPSLVRMLDSAMEADSLLDHVASTSRAHDRGDPHPLGSYVYQREVIELAAWPLTGRTPTSLVGPTSARRGPAPERPEVSAEAGYRFFDHLRRVVETARLEADALQHRQSLYLLSYDHRPDASSWLVEQFRRLPPTRSGWSTTWPAARTLAAGLVRHGDPDVLLDFIRHGLADEQGQIANLNYWAYWVGESSVVERDDSFMPIGLGRWPGAKLLRHLVDRLDTEAGVADLSIHTVRALLAARPHLLDEDRALTTNLAAIVDQVLDTGRTSAPAQQALTEIRYALRLHSR